jgi:hypothetical protein
VEALITAILIGLLATIAMIRSGEAKTQVSNNMGQGIVRDINAGIQRAAAEGVEIPMDITGTETDREVVGKIMQALAQSKYYADSAGGAWAKWLEQHNSDWGGLTEIPVGTVDITNIEVLFYAQ